jgi:hypothetical protein
MPVAHDTKWNSEFDCSSPTALPEQSTAVKVMMSDAIGILIVEGNRTEARLLKTCLSVSGELQVTGAALDYAEKNIGEYLNTV